MGEEVSKRKNPQENSTGLHHRKRIKGKGKRVERRSQSQKGKMDSLK